MPKLLDQKTAAEQLLSDILAAGYTVDQFIALLRVDPFEDTRPMPPISESDFWIIPPLRAG
ncbi:hypothetical protein [Nocardia mexicana]|uniref:Uncharacterized protein n=1 Tax=Nocardia mexicana TaxID=279262 RepID=A0A370GSP1_9NOCA|nr:hypothetical protein [Nocardia mexicana]RDI46717.1 hypothetical protein DFR68_110122 [Nocardia mexicana]